LTEAENVIPGQLKFIDDCDVDENTKGSAFICTDIRARKLPSSFRKTIDFIIVDEAKYWCTPERVKSLLCFNPIYSAGLCAERERKDGFDQVLSLFFGTNIFRKSVKPFKIWKLKTQFEPTIEQQNSRRGINWIIASQSLAFMDERNIMIRDLCRLRSGDKIMILVQFVDHVMILKKMLEDVKESVSTFCGSKDSYKACRILIATYSKAEMGFDDQNICENFDGRRLNLLILGADYKKDIEQSVGRIMRTEAPEVFDIVDKFATLQKHSDIRDKWYRTRCGRIMPAEYIFPVVKKGE
jgi:superfamily II DNA or RNA helicase